MLNEEFTTTSLWEGIDPPDQRVSPPTDLALPIFSQEKTPTNQWDPRFILDLAVGVDDLPEILLRYGLTLQEYELLSQTSAFRRDLALTIRDVRENGASFSLKAKTQAEDYLKVLDSMVYADDTPAGVRLEAIRSTVKWGKLETDKNTDQGNQNNQININISF